MTEGDKPAIKTVYNATLDGYDVNGVEQPAPVEVTQTEPWVMWTFGRDELVGQEVTFKFRYEDGTETGSVVKTIRAAR